VWIFIPGFGLWFFLWAAFDFLIPFLFFEFACALDAVFDFER
jgi:hypothetical protein